MNKCCRNCKNRHYDKCLIMSQHLNLSVSDIVDHLLDADDTTYAIKNIGHNLGLGDDESYDLVNDVERAIRNVAENYDATEIEILDYEFCCNHWE